jgi:hypothetical protein
MQLLENWTNKLRRRRRLIDLTRVRSHESGAIAIRKNKSAICMNCNVQLTGEFCHVCGQRNSNLKRPFWYFLMELTDNVFSAESKLAKTLVLLLLYPGGLTRNFMDGKRARYMPPVRLYLTVAFVFFLLMGIANLAILDIEFKPDDSNKTPEITSSEIVVESKPTLNDEDLAEIAKAKAEIDAQLTAVPEVFREQMKKNIDQIVAENKGPKLSINSDGFDFPYQLSVNMFVPLTTEKRPGIDQADIDKILAEKNTPDFVKKATVGFSNALKDPLLMNRLLNDWVPTAFLVLMPLFALMLRMFHWGRDRNLLSQLVFSLHYHTFLFLLMSSLIVIVPMFGAGRAAEVFWSGAFIYMFIALIVGQQQSILKAIFKIIFIGPMYLFVMGVVIFASIFRGLTEL